jgi:hypothetical protein
LLVWSCRHSWSLTKPCVVWKISWRRNAEERSLSEMLGRMEMKTTDNMTWSVSSMVLPVRAEVESLFRQQYYA